MLSVLPVLPGSVVTDPRRTALVGWVKFKYKLHRRCNDVPST